MSEVHRLIPKKERPIWPFFGDILSLEAAEMVDIPLLGYVAAGQPVEMTEYRERISVPAGMVRRDCYALRVRGKSMIDDNIQDGDIIVIEKCATAENGQSVVAMLNGETVTLKKFYIEKGGVRLQPANPDLAPIYLKNEDIRIIGVVRGVIRIP